MSSCRNRSILTGSGPPPASVRLAARFVVLGQLVDLTCYIHPGRLCEPANGIENCLFSSCTLMSSGQDLGMSCTVLHAGIEVPRPWAMPSLKPPLLCCYYSVFDPY